MNRERPPKRGSSAWLDSLVPSVAVDSVVFGFHGGDLKRLLIRSKGADVWVLPGGFVHHGESLDAAVRRLLLDRTGLRRVHLQQFHTGLCRVLPGRASRVRGIRTQVPTKRRPSDERPPA